MKIAYFGYDLFLPCLQTALDAGCEVLRLFTFPTDEVTESSRSITALCTARGIPVQHTRVKREDLLALQQQGCEALVVSGYIYRIPILPGLRAINVHPSPLPIGRGPWPWAVTILKGLPYSGVTIHKLEADFDTGDILIQRAYRVPEGATSRTLESLFVPLACELLRQCLPDFDRYWRIAVPQKGGEYWPEPGEDEKILRPDDPRETLDRRLRAFYGYGCTLRLPDGQEIPILRGRLRAGAPAAAPGTRLSATAYAVTDGILEILEQIPELPAHSDTGGLS